MRYDSGYFGAYSFDLFKVVMNVFWNTHSYEEFIHTVVASKATPTILHRLVNPDLHFAMVLITLTKIYSSKLIECMHPRIKEENLSYSHLVTGDETVISFVKESSRNCNA